MRFCEADHEAWTLSEKKSLSYRLNPVDLGTCSGSA